MNWLNFANGLKTFIGGLVLAGGGAAGMFFGVIDPGTGVSMIGAGVSVWGLGGKTEALTRELKTWSEAKKKEISIDVPKN